LTKTVRSSEGKGKLMENIVFLKLLRKKNLNPLMGDFTGKTIRGICREEGRSKAKLIQDVD
jgi:predicted AAA+ superfamily ATPase